MLKVSVIVPTHNCSYLPNAIDSILGQTFKDYEIIVVDDGSTDNTKALLSKFNGKIKYLYQDNKGPSSARNLGIKESEGQYIGFLDADDAWLSEKLEKEVNFLDKNTDFGMVTCDAYATEARNERIIVPSMAAQRRMHSGFVLKKVLRENFLLMLNVLIRREVLDDIGLFDEKRLFCEDYDLWVRVAKKYKIGYVNEVLAKYRIHGSNRSIINKEKVLNSHLEIVLNSFKDNKIRYIEKKNILSFNYFKFAYNYFGDEEMRKAREYFMMSIANNPLAIKSFFYIVITFFPITWIKFFRRIKKLLEYKNIDE